MSDIRDLLRYDPSTGEFERLIRTSNSVAIGEIAGCVNTNGYKRIRVGQNRYAAHRLAWFFVYGEWPNCLIDHINGDKGDNRIANLRAATFAENTRNQKKHEDNRSGARGVTWAPRHKKWRARIRTDYKLQHIGYFDTVAEASAAYACAAAQQHGEFARPGAAHP